MGLTKRDIIVALKNSDLPINSIYVVMGAALVLHGVKIQTSDIDVSCSTDLFISLLSRGYQQQYSHSMIPKIAYNDVITIYLEWKISEYTIIDGIRVEGIHDIIMDKRRLGRRKDMEDIRLCEAFWKERKLLT